MNDITVKNIELVRNLQMEQDKLIISFTGYTYSEGEPEECELTPNKRLWLTDINGEPVCKIEVFTP